MTPVMLLEQVRTVGGTLMVHGDQLTLSAARPLSVDMVSELRSYKAEIIAILASDLMKLDRDFHNHLFAYARQTHCCYPRGGLYCTEGLRLRGRCDAARKFSPKK
jgi:hypothetical protein